MTQVLRMVENVWRADDGACGPERPSRRCGRPAGVVGSKFPIRQDQQSAGSGKTRGRGRPTRWTTGSATVVALQTSERWRDAARRGLAPRPPACSIVQAGLRSLPPQMRPALHDPRHTLPRPPAWARVMHACRLGSHRLLGKQVAFI
eukprot:scaffold644_cov353-Prasinococcus_capsulatus_cf.AAC.11